MSRRLRMRVDIQAIINRTKRVRLRTQWHGFVDDFFMHLKMVIKGEADLEDFADLYLLYEGKKNE